MPIRLTRIAGTDLATQKPELLANLIAIAHKAHEPLREGTYDKSDLHERDKRAQFGMQDQPADLPPKPKPKNKAKDNSSAASPR